MREQAIIKRHFLCSMCRRYVAGLVQLWETYCMEAGPNSSTSPASCRRWRKGKSRIWDSKIWLQIAWESDSRMAVLARARNSCKRQTRPVVGGSLPHQQTHSWAPDGCSIPRQTGQLTVSHNISLRLSCEKVRNIGMTCFAKPVLTRGLVCSTTWEIFNDMLCMRYVHLMKCQACSQETNPSSCQRGSYLRTTTAKVQLKEKNSGRGSKGLDTKMNWLAVNHQSEFTLTLW
jgi:hypothetical protein